MLSNIGAWLVYALIFVVIVGVFFHDTIREQVGTHFIQTSVREAEPVIPDEWGQDFPIEEQPVDHYQFIDWSAATEWYPQEYSLYGQALIDISHEDWVTASEKLQILIEDPETAPEGAPIGTTFFSKYYPHRELGVALFYLDKFQQAFQYLVESTNLARTAKANHYHELTLQQIILAETPDEAPPRMSITFPRFASDIYIPGFETELSGQLEDDLRVVAFYANDDRIVIEPGTESSFQHTLRGLQSGANPFSARVVDLAGKEQQIEHTIIVDLDGPVIVVNDIETSPDGSRTVRGQVSDNHLLASLHVQGQPIDVFKQQEVIFEAKLPASTGSELEIIARDLAGNPTRYTQHIEDPIFTDVMVADTVGPEILSPRDEEIFFTALAGLRIEARDPSGVAQLFIAGEARPLTPGKSVTTHQLLPLDEGVNMIEIVARDTLGNETTRQIKVTRLVPSINAIDSRLTLAIAPLVTIGQGEVPIINELENMIREQGRFRVVSGLWGLVPPIDYQQDGQLNLPAIAEMAQQANLDIVLVGHVEYLGNTANVSLNLVDVRTATIVRSIEAFQEDTSTASVRYLCRLLNNDLENTYPRLDGKVVRLTDRQVVISFTDTTGLRTTTPVVVYLEDDPITDPDTGEVLGVLTEELAEAQITRITDRLVFAELVSGNLEELTAGLSAVVK